MLEDEQDICCHTRRGKVKLHGGESHEDPFTHIDPYFVAYPDCLPLMPFEGIYVRGTRTSIAEEMVPQARCDIANSDPDVDVFISVHHEGLPTVSDTRTFYYGWG